MTGNSSIRSYREGSAISSKYSISPFGRFLIVACIALLTWWQIVSRAADWQLLTVFLSGLGALSSYLTVKAKRVGLALAVVVGTAYLAELFLSVSATDLMLVSPMVVWAGLVVVVSLGLLHATRDRGRQQQQEYQRYTPY